MGGASQARTWGPFTGRQLTAIVIAIIVGGVLVPSTVWAVDTFSNVAIEDPVSGSKAAVDSARRLTIAGPVSGSVSAIPRPPTSPWYASQDVFTPTPVALAGPSATPINLTSLSVGFKSSGTADLTLRVRVLSSTGTDCVNGGIIREYTIYHVPGLLSGAGGFSASFPTPLQARPTSGQKVCLTAYQQVNSPPTITVNASGYFGS